MKFRNYKYHRQVILQSLLNKFIEGMRKRVEVLYENDFYLEGNSVFVYLTKVTELLFSSVFPALRFSHYSEICQLKSQLPKWVIYDLFSLTCNIISCPFAVVMIKLCLLLTVESKYCLLLLLCQRLVSSL